MVEHEPNYEHVDEIWSFTSIRFTRSLRSEFREKLHAGDTDCCFSVIQFKKLYPADMKVTLTAEDGRTVERKFTASKTIRTAFIKKKGDDDDDSDQSEVVLGGLGRWVDVDVEIADTSSATLAIVHYHFRLCCDDKKVHPGTVLTFVEKPTIPNGQVVNLPLLRITAVRRSPCPEAQ